MASDPGRESILVYGIGNPALTDDGIGPRLVDDLESSCGLPNISFKKGLVGGLEIVESVAGYGSVLFVDAIRTREGIPGSVYEFSVDDFRETLHLSNLHDISFLTALEMARKLNIPIPERIGILAVEVVEDLVFSEEFSPEVRKCYPAILEKAENQLRRFARPRADPAS